MSVTRQTLVAFQSRNATGLFLYCPDCHAEYSANPGDYFTMGMDTPMICTHGGADMIETPLDLATRRTEIIVVGTPPGVVRDAG